MSVYKHQYATIDVGFSRGHVPRRFESMKRLFPDEHAFVPHDVLSQDTVNFDDPMPHLSL